jgi:LysR family transcriptional activator of nhaA
VATLRQKGAPGQALRIGALATLSRNFQLAFLKPLLGRADVEVILRSGSAAELFTALSALHLDLVLTNRPPPSDALTPYIVRPIDSQTVSLIGVPERCLADRTLAQRLDGAALILPTKESGLRMGFDALTDRLGVRPRIVAEVDDMAMMRLLAREGIGLAVLPPIVVRDELWAGTLVECAELPGLTETFYGVSVERRYPNPLLAEVMGGA